MGIKYDFSSCVRVQIYPVVYSKTSNNLFILHLINKAWLFKRLKTGSISQSQRVNIPTSNFVLVNVFFGFCLSTNSEISSSVSMMTFSDWTRRQQWVTVTRRLTRLSVYLKTSAYTTMCFFHSDHFYGQLLFYRCKTMVKCICTLSSNMKKIRTVLDPIRENIGRSRGTIKGR